MGFRSDEDLARPRGGLETCRGVRDVTYHRVIAAPLGAHESGHPLAGVDPDV